MKNIIGRLINVFLIIALFFLSMLIFANGSRLDLGELLFPFVVCIFSVVFLNYVIFGKFRLWNGKENP
jgi:hypothetical protein